MFCNYSLSLYFPYNFGQPNHFKHLKINVIKTANVVLVNTSKTTFRQIFFLTRTILSSKQKPRYAQKKTKELKMNTPLSLHSVLQISQQKLDFFQRVLQATQIQHGWVIRYRLLVS